MCPLPDDSGLDDGGTDDGDMGPDDAEDSDDGGSDDATVPGGPPAPSGKHGGGHGDPHLLTFDGVRYDCQPWGEETLCKSMDGNLEVQIRTHQLNAENVAVIQGVAANVMGDRVAFYLDGTTTENGTSVAFPPSRQGTTLPDGGIVWNTGGRYVVVWPGDGSQLQVSLDGYAMGVDMYLAGSRNGQVYGLLGNANDVTSDDLMLRDGGGPLVSPAPFGQFYGSYVNSWRITQDTSLFDYSNGETTQSPDITNFNFPRVPETIADLPPGVPEAGAAVCQEAGVVGDWINSCALDVSLEDASSAALPFVGALQPVTSFDINPPLPDPDYAWYVLDETSGTTAHDSSPNHFDITNLTGVTWDAGANFGENVCGSRTVTEAFRTPPLSISAWLTPALRTDAPSTHAIQPYPQSVLSDDIPGVGGFALGLDVWSKGSALAVEGLGDCSTALCAARTIQNANDADGGPSCTSPANCNQGFLAGTEYFVVLAIAPPGDAGAPSAAVYVNGALFDQTTADSISTQASPPLYLGCVNLDTGYGTARFFDGHMRDVRVYKRELAAGEVQQLYLDGPTLQAPPADAGIVDATVE